MVLKFNGEEHEMNYYAIGIFESILTYASQVRGKQPKPEHFYFYIQQLKEIKDNEGALSNLLSGMYSPEIIAIFALKHDLSIKDLFAARRLFLTVQGSINIGEISKFSEENIENITGLLLEKTPELFAKNQSLII